MKTIVVLTDAGLAPEAIQLAEDSGFRVEIVDSFLSESDLSQELQRLGPVALVPRLGKVTRAIISSTQTLRLIVKHGSGFEDIDLEAATDRGIPVLITRGSNSQSVAEHALGLMFAVAQKLTALDTGIRAGNWDRKQYDGFELRGKSLGIVGFGSIAKALVDLVRPLQMTIRVCDPHMHPAGDYADLQKVDSLSALLRSSDIVSLHCQLTPETRGLIGQRQFLEMKDGAIIINTARGGIIDEAALASALMSGKIAGAGVDAFEKEPPTADNPLLRIPSIVLSPHVGGNSREAKLRTGVAAITHVINYFRDGTLPSSDLVNPQVAISSANMSAAS